MNFCKENEKFISLYIDELLDDKSRLDFVKHIEECKECATKLKEASYFAYLCREDQDMQLPVDFSASLHTRLLGESSKEGKSKIGLFVYNKKFIASLSTAAILVISLMAYNLLPHMGTKHNASRSDYETAQVEASSIADGIYEDKGSIAGQNTDEIVSSESYATTKQADSKEIQSDIQLESKAEEPNSKADNSLRKVVPQINEKTSEPSTSRQNNESGDSSSNTDSTNKREIQSAATFMIQADQDVTNNHQYFSNYAELNMKVTSSGIEIEELRKFMNEAGGFELKPVTINNMAVSKEEYPVESTVEASVLKAQYIDYCISLGIFSTLENQASKYKLELTTKTDIVKNDITYKYNELNAQKILIDKQIAEALKKDQDVANFEAEKTRLTEDINRIITQSEMVTVRFFFMNK